jgi:hypothetical protein
MTVTPNSLLLWREGDEVEQGDQGGTVRQLTLVDERADLDERHPLDSVGLSGVRRWTLLGSAAGREVVRFALT